MKIDQSVRTRLAGIVADGQSMTDTDSTRARAEKAEASEEALGMQVAAQAARLRLADALADACASGSIAAVNDALAAWDAVPGDVGGER